MHSAEQDLLRSVVLSALDRRRVDARQDLLLGSLATIAAALSGGCVAATDEELDRFDGTYDYSVTVVGAVYQVSQSFYVTNGEISNSEGSFSGSVLDDFGNVEFTGPCPSGSTGGAVYTGILNEGNPKFGQGSWSCSGSPGSTWRVYNGN